MKLKKFLKLLKKIEYPINKRVIEYFNFVIPMPYLRCKIDRTNNHRIGWIVKYLGKRNEVHPSGKWQSKKGDSLESLIDYLRLKGVELFEN